MRQGLGEGRASRHADAVVPETEEMKRSELGQDLCERGTSGVADVVGVKNKDLQASERGDGTDHFTHHFTAHVVEFEVQVDDVVLWSSQQPRLELPQLIWRQLLESKLNTLDFKLAVSPAAGHVPQVQLTRQLLIWAERHP